jgi:Putative cyclase
VIPLSHLQRVVADQNVTFRPGDILFIRSGFTAAYKALSPPEQLALSQRPSADFIGVEPTEEILEWLWESRFAAVAGDSPSFECSPVGRGKGKDDVPPPVVLHQWLLAGWGMPIGEMFDLEDLAEHCRESGRWSFFLTSIPLKASNRAQPLPRFLLGASLSQCCGQDLIGDTGTWWCGESSQRSRHLLARRNCTENCNSLGVSCRLSYKLTARRGKK